MKNYIFGYARVSTEAQNLDRQLDALKRYGVRDFPKIASSTFTSLPSF